MAGLGPDGLHDGIWVVRDVPLPSYWPPCGTCGGAHILQLDGFSRLRADVGRCKGSSRPPDRHDSFWGRHPTAHTARLVLLQGSTQRSFGASSADRP